MARKKQRDNFHKVNTILCLGDSQTDYMAVYGVMPGQMWSAQLAKRLNLSGCLTRSRVFAKAGDTTSQIIGRNSDSIFMYDSPKIGIVYGGVNDPGTVSGVALSGTSNTIQLAADSNANPNSYVGYVINLTAGNGSGQSKTIVSYNSLTKTATLDSNWSVIPNSTTGYSIASPSVSTMQANHQALIKCFKYKATGNGSGLGNSVVLWSVSMLPANGKLGQRYVIMQDIAPTSGAPVTHDGQNPNIDGNYSTSPIQSVWEFRNQQSGVQGWARVAIASTPAFEDGVDKVITVSSNYLNFNSGGDTFNVSTGIGTQYTPYINVRIACKNAAEAEGTVYCDLYSFQSALIYGGVFENKQIQTETAQGSNSWHYTTNNQHHNAYGHDTVARAVELTILNQSGWIEDLSK